VLAAEPASTFSDGGNDYIANQWQLTHSTERHPRERPDFGHRGNKHRDARPEGEESWSYQIRDAKGAVISKGGSVCNANGCDGSR
jgi:hypothetical protein